MKSDARQSEGIGPFGMGGRGDGAAMATHHRRAPFFRCGFPGSGGLAGCLRNRGELSGET